MCYLVILGMTALWADRTEIVLASIGAWFNIFFSKFESLKNTAIVLNPDPSAVISDWTE